MRKICIGGKRNPCKKYNLKKMSQSREMGTWVKKLPEFRITGGKCFRYGMVGDEAEEGSMCQVGSDSVAML